MKIEKHDYINIHKSTSEQDQPTGKYHVVIELEIYITDLSKEEATKIAREYKGKLKNI